MKQANPDRKNWTGWAGTGVLMLAIIGAAAWAGQQSSMLPSDVQGVWTTDDSRYQGRSMELSPAFVILLTGQENAPSVQWVNQVKTEAAGNGTEITVVSTDRAAGAEYEMAIVYSPANGGEIRFKNQPQVWKRAK